MPTIICHSKQSDEGPAPSKQARQPQRPRRKSLSQSVTDVAQSVTEFFSRLRPSNRPERGGTLQDSPAYWHERHTHSDDCDGKDEHGRSRVREEEEEEEKGGEDKKEELLMMTPKTLSPSSPRHPPSRSRPMMAAMTRQAGFVGWDERGITPTRARSLGRYGNGGDSGRRWQGGDKQPTASASVGVATLHHDTQEIHRKDGRAAHVASRQGNRHLSCVVETHHLIPVLLQAGEWDVAGPLLHILTTIKPSGSASGSAWQVHHPGPPAPRRAPTSEADRGRGSEGGAAGRTAGRRPKPAAKTAAVSEAEAETEAEEKEEEEARSGPSVTEPSCGSSSSSEQEPQGESTGLEDTQQQQDAVVVVDVARWAGSVLAVLAKLAAAYWQVVSPVFDGGSEVRRRLESATATNGDVVRCVLAGVFLFGVMAVGVWTVRGAVLVVRVVGMVVRMVLRVAGVW
ncbi:hypothetical protein VTJ04DRAFT_4456 [Mycothermus thermophilus]|uniref:uncharacterized protein n=1 Tax=Humicola insolens TaxID=85995 RepID=UPI003743CFD9